jgi:hypothetical protein
MREYLELGSVPFGENCVQVGADDYYTKYKEESNRYIEQLKHRFPEINNINCYFSIKGFPHEFGTYHEVVINYNDNDDAATNGHNDTLLLLKKEFPKIKGTSGAFEGAKSCGRGKTVRLLKKEFPEIKPIRNSFMAMSYMDKISEAFR